MGFNMNKIFNKLVCIWTWGHLVFLKQQKTEDQIQLLIYFLSIPPQIQEDMVILLINKTKWGLKRGWQSQNFISMSDMNIFEIKFMQKSQFDKAGYPYPLAPSWVCFPTLAHVNDGFVIQHLWWSYYVDTHAHIHAELRCQPLSSVLCPDYESFIFNTHYVPWQPFATYQSIAHTFLHAYMTGH